MEKAKFDFNTVMQQVNTELEQRKVEFEAILRKDQLSSKGFFPVPRREDSQMTFLEELATKKFWHAYKSLVDLSGKGTITKEKTLEYSWLIVEQARRADPLNLGNAWLAENCYKEGNLLRRHLSDPEFASVVNEGFWEFAMMYFKTYHGYLYSEEAKRRYGVLISSEFLDLSRVEEFRKKVGLNAPLPRNYYGWPDYQYLEAFNKARPKINDKATVAWLAHPIIDQMLSEVSGGKKDLALRKEFESYKDILVEPVIQTLFKNTISERLDSLQFDATRVEPLITFIKPHLMDSNEQLQEFINTHIPWDATNLHENVMRSSFPRNLLNNNAFGKLQKLISTDLDERLQKDELLGYITLASDAMRSGFIEPDAGKKLLSSALEELYLSCKRRPSGETVINLLYSISANALGIDLFQKVVRKGIDDLELRHRKDAAEEWRRKLGIAEKPIEKIQKSGPLDAFATK